VRGDPQQMKARKLARTIGVIGLIGRIPFVGPLYFATDVQQAVDVADLKHLVAASDWGHRPVSWGYLMPPPSMASFANRIANDRLPLREKAPAPSKPNGEPAQSDTPEKQDIAVKNNGKNQADAKKDAKEKSASDSRVSARVSPHRYYNYYAGRHYGGYRRHHYGWYPPLVIFGAFGAC
jgi:hypothetical protein